MELIPPSKFLVQSKLQGYKGGFLLSWEPCFLATKYNVYHNYTPYGVGTLVWSGTDLSLSQDPDLIMGTVSYYRVSSVGSKGEEVSTPWTTVSDPLGYIAFNEGTYIGSKEATDNPNTNLYLGGIPSIKPGTTNPLPSNILRRYQLNTIKRRGLFELQHCGEPCFLIKPKRHNYTNPDKNQDRLLGKEDMVEYHQPLPIWARIVSADATLNVEQQGAWVKKKPMSWTVVPPYVESGDILVNRENKRFEVVNCTVQRSFGGVDTWQQWDSMLLPPTDRAYIHPTIANLDINLLVAIGSK